MSRKFTPNRNTKNLLKGIAPVAVNWSVIPGTVDDLTNETMGEPLTNAGTSLANATLTWDMGRIYRCVICLDHQDPDMITWTSRDGVNYFQTSLSNIGMIAGLWRFIQVRCGAHASINYIKMIVYEI